MCVKVMCADAGTMDPSISKLLFLHVSSRHPTMYPEVELSPLVQAAALMGIGLLYRGSCHRYYGLRSHAIWEYPRV